MFKFVNQGDEALAAVGRVVLLYDAPVFSKHGNAVKRLVVVDLKLGKFRPEYKGQMELYLRWLARYEREEGEALPLGIILCAEAKTEQLEMLELGEAGIHVAEYLTVLPAREVLESKLHRAIEAARLRFENRQPGGEA